MTVFQILALAIGGPIALMSLVILIHLLIRDRGSWGIGGAMALIVPIVIILVAFLGVK